jgi:hypothetical protein
MKPKRDEKQGDTKREKDPRNCVKKIRNNSTDLLSVFPIWSKLLSVA